MREKDFGIWQTWRWREVLAEVRALACGLHSMGLRRGAKLAVIGDNRPRLYWTIAASQALGGVPVPLYQDAVAAEMAYPIQNAAIAHAVVEDQEQVDKLLEILPQCPSLSHIYFDEPRGLRHYTQPQLMSFEKLLEIGAQKQKQESGFLDAEIAKGSSADTAAMFFTSGTTGAAKGVVLTHLSLIDRARAAAEMEGLGDTDVALAYLYGIPDTMFLVLPAAVLFATVFTIGAFTRHSELTAAKASGISFHRFILPIALGALGATFVGLALTEIVPPLNARRLELLQEKTFRNANKRSNFAYAAEEGRVYKIAYAEVASASLQAIDETSVSQ